MNNPYGIDIAPLNIFENQVIPIGVHNLSKSFRPNMATIPVLSLGTKFIPKWRDTNIKNIFRKFGDFKRRLQNSMFYVETMPGTFGQNKQCHLNKIKDKKRKMTVIKASERLILSILWLSTRVDVYISISF